MILNRPLFMLFFIQLSYAYECLSFGFIQGLEHAIAGTDLVVGTILEELKMFIVFQCCLRKMKMQIALHHYLS